MERYDRIILFDIITFCGIKTLTAYWPKKHSCRALVKNSTSLNTDLNIWLTVIS